MWRKRDNRSATPEEALAFLSTNTKLCEVLQKKLGRENVTFVVDKDATHSEEYWRIYFEKFIKWAARVANFSQTCVCANAPAQPTLHVLCKPSQMRITCGINLRICPVQDQASLSYQAVPWN